MADLGWVRRSMEDIFEHRHGEDYTYKTTYDELGVVIVRYDHTGEGVRLVELSTDNARRLAAQLESSAIARDSK